MIKSPLRHALCLTTALALSACATVPADGNGYDMVDTQVPADIDTFFEQYDEAQLALSPQTKAYRGIRDEDYGQWNDASEAADEARDALRDQWLQRMRDGYALSNLSPEDQLSYRLFEATAERSQLLEPFEDYEWYFDQMNGAQSGIPAFLINTHAVQNVDHARDYIERIEGIGPLLDTLIARSAEGANEGVMPPDWVYPYVLSDIRNILDAGLENAVLEDFRSEVADLEITDAEKARLVADAEAAWSANAQPAYTRLLAEMERQQAMAPTQDGIWRLPEGAAYYDALLEY